MTDEELKSLFEALHEENAATRQEMREQTTAIRQELTEQTTSTRQAMIKFSHAELDRRMRTLEGTQRTLEEGLADLQARVDRLESTTH